MSAHSCRHFNPDCYRCDLGLDEVTTEHVKRVARALFIEANAPLTRPGDPDYEFFSQRWEERHASGNTRTSADFRYTATVAIEALTEDD